MDFWSFSKSLLWTSLSWQLCQNLWCHWTQLSIVYVQRVSHFSHFHYKYYFQWCTVLVLCHCYIISEKMRIIASLTICKKKKFCENLCTLPMGSFPQWHHRFWRSCQLEDVHNKDLLKLQKSITLLKRIVQFCSNLYC